jgi:hypothetical protein
MRWARLLAAVLLVALAFVSPAGAVTAADVLGRMTDKERSGYITGTVDTILYLEQTAGRGTTPRSACIRQWFYGAEARGPRQIIAILEGYPERPAVGLIKILIDRACKV